MTDTIKSIKPHVISIPRETPYMGPLGEGETINDRGYFVRRGNRSIYPTTDMSVLIRVETEHGAVGWGECYGICAPEAVVAIIEDLLAPLVIGRDPFDAAVIWEDLYDLMRVRGFNSGYYVDSLAGLDIGIWDVAARLADMPLCKMLGGQRVKTMPVYVSGLPRPTLPERVEFALEFQSRGFNAFKFAAAISQDRVVEEATALRTALGDEARIMIDMHWKHTAAEALSIINALAPLRLDFAEAPCRPEDIEGLAQVAARSPIPIAAGEEWHTVYETLPRLERRACSVLQPEIAHTGVTQFMAIGGLAQAFHAKIVPHASIGIGVFQAASLHAAAALQQVTSHEYQHSVFDRNLQFTDGDMACADGVFVVPTGPGLGVTPRPEVFAHERKVR